MDDRLKALADELRALRSTTRPRRLPRDPYKAMQILMEETGKEAAVAFRRALAEEGRE